MGVLATALGVMTISGYVQLSHVYTCVFAFAFGAAAAALDASLGQTVVGQLVGDERLPNAVALNSTSLCLGGLIGLAVARLIIAKVGAGWEIFLNRLSYGAVLLPIYRIRVHELRTNARASRALSGFIEGICFVWIRPDFRAYRVMLLPGPSCKMIAVLL